MDNATVPQYKTRKEIIKNWDPENPVFWEKYGRRIAKQNLYVSTWALVLSFCVWSLWTTIAVHLDDIGFHFTYAQLFTLAALPGLVGATGRFFYTYMPSLVGGMKWTFFSTAIMLVPLVGLGRAVQDTSTSYMTLAIYVSLIGIAGANFASSMSNIGGFYPVSKRGTALGIDGGVGNLGVSLVYFVAPFVLTSASVGGLFGAPQYTHAHIPLYLQAVCYIWIIPIIITLGLILKFMDDLPIKPKGIKGLVSMFGKKHTWVLAWLYTCGFGSFIGFSFALSLLVKKEFPEVSFGHLAFLGPFLGAGIRPFGGWLSDKIKSGAAVTFYGLLVMLAGTAAVLFSVHTHNYTIFLTSFMIIFAATGFVNGATFRMVPHVFDDGLQASLVTGFISSVAAYGAFIVPKLFGWSYGSSGSPDAALYILFGFTLITIALTYGFYYRLKDVDI